MIPLGVTPNVLVVPASRNFRSVGELVAAAKSQPGKLTYGSGGVGTATHFNAERFLASTATEALHVPFKGGPEIVSDLLAGRIDFFFGPIGIVRPHVLSGKLNALAVNSTKRSALLPEVPTLGEAGVANAEYPFWIGMLLRSDVARDRRQVATRDARRASSAGRAGQACGAWRGSDADGAWRIRCADPERDRSQRGIGKGSRHQGAVTPVKGRPRQDSLG